MPFCGKYRNSGNCANVLSPYDTYVVGAPTPFTIVPKRGVSDFPIEKKSEFELMVHTSQFEKQLAKWVDSQKRKIQNLFKLW